MPTTGPQVLLIQTISTHLYNSSLQLLNGELSLQQGFSQHRYREFTILVSFTIVQLIMELLDLYRNGKIETRTKHDKSTGPSENGGNGLTLLLEKGDQVCMVLQKDNWIWDSDYSKVTVFSGFLIDAL